MRGWILTLALAAWSSTAAAQDAAAVSPSTVSQLHADLSQGVSIDDLRAVVSDAGGVVEIVKEKDDNGFEVETNFPGDWSPWIDTHHCTGDGDARRCPEYEIGVEVRARSAALARAAERKLQFKYLSTSVDGDLITFTRLDTTAGGVTREHISQELRDVVTIMSREVAPVVWPGKRTR
ncbi:MAG TPA: hypothetical protein VGL66_17620 [Caulobacteraceae bacterium]|jgi:hypothetical protein